MAQREIIRGDDYGVRQPFYRFTFVTDTNAPLPLSGFTILTTYKTKPTDPSEDPNDASAAIKHVIKINSSGVATEQNGLYMEGTAASGKIVERLTAAETKGLPLGEVLYSDVQVTDASGETFTWIMEDTLIAKDGYTNRSG